MWLMSTINLWGIIERSFSFEISRVFFPFKYLKQRSGILLRNNLLKSHMNLKNKIAKIHEYTN